MDFSFLEKESDETLIELSKTAGALVSTITAQYEIKTDLVLNKEFFQDEGNFSFFFKKFAEYANPFWTKKFNSIWDFSKVPFRESNSRIEGVIKILRTGGPLTEVYEKETAIAMEEEFRREFQGDSSELVIFCIANYEISDESLSFTVDIKDLSKISNWFELLAWDDLIFIINPKYNSLYVIAFTDED